MCGRTGPSGCECRGGSRVGTERARAALSGERGEIRDIRPERSDPERYGGRALELLLQPEVPPRVVNGAVLGVSQGCKSLVPRLCVRAREARRVLLDRERLGRDTGGVGPRGARAAGDHSHETSRERHGERGSRPAAGGMAVGGEAFEERVEPQVEVVLGLQSKDESTTTAKVFLDFCLVPLYLTEADVASLVEPIDAVEAIEECFRRMAAGEIEIAPRRRLRLPDGALADMAASDVGLGLAGGKLYAATAEGATFVVCLFDAVTSDLEAVIEADHLGRLRTGAASGVAARHLARGGAQSLGVIGCGHQAEAQVDCIRAAVPSIERVVAYCRTPERLASFCERADAEPGDSHRDAGKCDVVVTITSSRDPVLRGEWLAPGALVIAAGANVVSRRELDNAVLERASFVCCDWLEQARIESGDLAEPVLAGVLDWLEVHEVHEVVAGELAGRQSDRDIVLFKSNGIAAWDVALGAEVLRRAREQGVGASL